jgi:hypothetical protein
MVYWNQTKTNSWKVSNQIPKKIGVKLKPSAEMSQTDIQNRMESNRNKELNGINPNTEIEWNQSKTNS